MFKWSNSNINISGGLVFTKGGVDAADVGQGGDGDSVIHSNDVLNVSGSAALFLRNDKCFSSVTTLTHEHKTFSNSAAVTGYTVPTTWNSEFGAWLPERPLVKKDATLKDISISMDSGSGGKIKFSKPLNPAFDPSIKTYNVVKKDDTRIKIFMDKGVKGQTATATMEGKSCPIFDYPNRFETDINYFTEPSSEFIVTVKSQDGSKTETYKIMIANEEKLTGKVTISGKEQLGEFLKATVSDTNNTGTLSYLWSRSSDVGDITTGDTYYVDERFDKDNIITCKVTSSVQTGSISASTGKIVDLTNDKGKDEIDKDEIDKDKIDKAIEEALKDKEDKPLIAIEVDQGITENEFDINISSEAIDSILNTKNGSLSISSGKIKIVFDNSAMIGIKKQAGNKPITIHESLVAKEKLNSRQKESVGDNKVYELLVTSGGEPIKDFNGNVTVSLPYTAKTGENHEAIVLYYLDTKGDLKVIRNGKYDVKLGTVIFTTNHFSYYMIKNNYLKFNDIKDNHWAKPAIDFAAARGLVIGVGENKYNPSGTLTRAQLIQMIQNVLNLPVASKDLASYGDVESKSWFYGPIMSAKSAGLLKGIKLDGDKFMPNQPITREEMALILANTASYKKASIPEEKVDLTKFKDYKDINKDFVDQILIAMNLGLLSKEGKGNGTFAPKATTTRAEAAQVQINLFKALNLFD